MGVLTAIVGWQVSFRIVTATILILAAITYFYLVRRSHVEPKSEENLGQLYLNALRPLSNSKILSLLLVGFSFFYWVSGYGYFST
jgi:hypothetical protein